MKIAAVTDDGVTISAHFGRGRQYPICEVKDGELGEIELRDKPGRHTCQGQHDHQHDAPHSHHAGGHGMGAEAKGRHEQIMGSISNCQVLLASGMGAGASLHLTEAGIQPIVTDVEGFQTAVMQVIEGTIEDFTERLH